MNSRISSSAYSLKVSNVTIFSFLKMATTFWRLINAAANATAILLSIRLFKLRLDGDWLFQDSFGDVKSPSLSD